MCERIFSHALHKKYLLILYVLFMCLYFIDLYMGICMFFVLFCFLFFSLSCKAL